MKKSKKGLIKPNAHGDIHLPDTLRIGKRTDKATPGAEWWKEETGPAVDSVTSNLSFWATHQRARLSQYHRYARLYGNQPQRSMSSTDVSRLNALRERLHNHLTANVTKSCVDTVAAKIGKSKPKPYYVSTAGDYKAQRQCRSLNTFVTGVSYECKTHAHMYRALLDALIWGEGWVHTLAKHDRVVQERVPLDEIWVDEVEALSTNSPRQLHRVRNVDRNLLIGRFPDAAAILREASCELAAKVGMSNSLADIVTLRESWYLGDGDEPGKHLLSVDTGPLSEIEDYDREFYPFARLCYSDRPFGWFSSGMVEECEPGQMEIDRLYWGIQESIEAAGSYKAWVKTGSGVNVDLLGNDFGLVIEGDEPPQFLLPMIVQAEVYQQLETLIQREYQMRGVSQLSANGTVPVGIKSGEGQRVYNDINTERFAPLAQRFEEFACELGRQSITTVQEIIKGGAKSYRVKSPDTTSLEEIDWKDLEFDPDKFVIQSFPVSSLPNDPAGRYDKITEMTDRGWLDPDTARDLLDMPDLDKVETLFRQQRDRIAKCLESIVDDDEYIGPDEYDNLDLAHTSGIRYLKWAQNHNVPGDRILKIGDYIKDVIALKKKAAAQIAADAAQNGGGAPPGAAPMPAAPPISPQGGAPALAPTP